MCYATMPWSVTDVAILYQSLSGSRTTIFSHSLLGPHGVRTNRDDYATTLQFRDKKAAAAVGDG